MKSWISLGVICLLNLLCRAQVLPSVDDPVFQRIQQLSEIPPAERLKQELRKLFNQTDLHEFTTVGKALSDLYLMFKLAMYPTAIVDWQKANVSKQCYDDSNLYLWSNIYGSLSFDVGPVLWAMKMYEATGNYPDGFLDSLNIHAVGLFDECLNIRPPGLNFTGKYCTVFLNPEPLVTNETAENMHSVPAVPMKDARTGILAYYQYLHLLLGSTEVVEPRVADAYPFVWGEMSMGFCLPSSCSSRDFRASVAQLVGSFVMNTGAGDESIVTINDNYCSSDSDPAREFDGIDITVLVVLSILASLVVAATIQEIVRNYLEIPVHPKESGTAARALHCFSALNNGRKLLSTKSSAESLSCLHGIRVLSTSWVLIGHLWSQCSTEWNVSGSLLFRDGLKWEMQVITNAYVVVDTFFLIGGLLVAYMLLRELDKGRSGLQSLQKILLSYVHRYLRLTPVYAFILGFIATLLVYCGNGPNWYQVTVMSEGCRINGWTNLLYINNAYRPDPTRECMGETWYLAVDMQLFLVSPLLIYPMWRWKTAGLTLLALFTLGTLASNFAIYTVYELPPTLISTRLDSLVKMGEFFDKYYFEPYTRAPPYLMGIFLGWILYETKKPSFRLHFSPTLRKLLITAGWAFSIATGLAIVYGLIPYVDESKVPEIDPAVSIIYGSMHRFAWAVAVAWVIFACIKGYGGFVNTLLSWKAFQPLGRLTYCFYLIHRNYLFYYFANMRHLNYYTAFSTTHTFLGLLLTVFLLSFVVSVTIEASFLNLEKLIFSPLTSDKAANTKKTSIDAPEDGSIPPTGQDNAAFIKGC